MGRITDSIAVVTNPPIVRGPTNTLGTESQLVLRATIARGSLPDPDLDREYGREFGDCDTNRCAIRCILEILTQPTRSCTSQDRSFWFAPALN